MPLICQDWDKLGWAEYPFLFRRPGWKWFPVLSFPCPGGLEISMKCLVIKRCKITGRAPKKAVGVKNDCCRPKWDFRAIFGPAGPKWIYWLSFSARPGGNGFIDCIFGPARPDHFQASCVRVGGSAFSGRRRSSGTAVPPCSASAYRFWLLLYKLSNFTITRRDNYIP